MLLIYIEIYIQIIVEEKYIASMNTRKKEETFIFEFGHCIIFKIVG